MNLCKRYGLQPSRRIRNHKVEEVIYDRPKGIEIRVDKRLSTDVKLSANRPDIYIRDMKRKVILLIEVGITSLDNLKEVETHKAHKYDVLRDELELLYPGYKAQIMPFVLTWDGIITKNSSLITMQSG